MNLFMTFNLIKYLLIVCLVLNRVGGEGPSTVSTTSTRG